MELISGVAHVPRGDSNFHSFGLLVRDLGKAPNVPPQFDPDGNRKTQAAIKFVTQYLLRVDMTVDGARGERANQLSIGEISIVPMNGRPLVQAIIENDTDTPFQFEAQARVDGPAISPRSKPIRLVMPIRFSMQNEERFVGRVLPKSRARMEEFIPEAILKGTYQVEIELISHGKKIASKRAYVDVDPNEYPAQLVAFAHVGEGVVITPAQIELSRMSGGSRTLAVTFRNNGHSNQSVSLKAEGQNASPLSEVKLRPSTFTLPPQSTRKVILTLSGTSQLTASKYGLIDIQAATAGSDATASRRLPIAILANRSQAAEISVSDLRFNTLNQRPAFISDITNQSDSHFPLNARLMIEDAQGRSTAIFAGFGRWLMPHQSTELQFPAIGGLSPGEYQLTCEIETAGDPIALRQKISVTDLENSAQAIRTKYNR